MSEGVVFDLGYRPHEGERMGRGGAIRALYRDGIRRVFGIRRRARRKIFPALLIGFAILPALFFTAFGVIAGEFGADAFFDHPDYFNWTGNITLVFCALAASELVVPDRIHGTMAVYASRPLRAVDYLAARAASMAAVVFGFVWLPHLLLLIGRAWTSNDGFGDYLIGHLDVLWETALATVVYLLAYGALAFLVAVFSSRTTLAVVIYLIVLAAWRATIEALVDAGYEIAALGAVPDHPGYVKDWIMSADSENWLPERAGFDPVVSLGIIVAIGVATGFVALRRYRSEL